MQTPEDRGRARRLRGQERGGLIIGGVIGLLLGSAVAQNLWGALSGTALGVLWVSWRQARRRGEVLDQAWRQLEARVHQLETAPPVTPAADEERAASEEARVAPEAASAPPESPAPTRAPRPAAEPRRVAEGGMIPPSRARRRVEPRPPDFIEHAVGAVRQFFLGGNTVVRVGVLVLLVGVTTLAKWAADLGYFPVEARLGVAGLMGLALIVLGYRMRDSRPDFATTLQGGGIAALYLVVFFAFRIFDLVPSVLAFVLFVGIAVACGVLAVVQRSQPLIFIGSVGGFLAPVLASTSQGNHVALFSYYLVLNVAIAAVAWSQTWRGLNVMAFVATYGVATLWGVLRYRPEHFATTEPFLLAYLLLFTGIAVLFALRQPPRLAGLVDGTLVFGTPLVTLLAQARLVHDIEFGMAYSTAGFGLLYVTLATWVWRRSPDALRRLAEAFIALAVVFGTMAIPLGLDDGLSTTLVWALEGTGLYWVGTRQDRRLPRYTGIGLQLLAAGAFVWGLEMSGFSARRPEFMAIANPRFLACLALALSGFFIAREAYAARDRIAEQEWWWTQGLGGWGLLWWAGGALTEIEQFIASDWEIAAVLALIAASGVALERSADRARWLPGRLLALAALPAAALTVPAALGAQPHLFAHAGVLAWPACWLGIYVVLRKIEECELYWTRHAYGPALWLVAVVTALGLGGLAEQGLGLERDWALAAFGVGLGGWLLGAHFFLERALGPFGRFPRIHLELGMEPLVGLALLWSLAVNLTARGDTHPLPYLPLLNAADLSLALIAVAVLTWWSRLRTARPEVLREEWSEYVTPALGGLAFIWLNAVLVRTVHQWTDVAFRADRLWDSVPLQVSFSIVWTLVALGGMLHSTRHGRRTRWITFATLLGVTVIKLFIVDLSQLTTGAKIGTFLVVGMLLLVIGYLSPVPPSQEASGEPALAGAEGGEAS